MVDGNECGGSDDLFSEVAGVILSPEFVFDVREHIAFCFTCVGRSLPSDQQAAVVLREMIGLTNRESAEALQVTESVFRHYLSVGGTAGDVEYNRWALLISQLKRELSTGL